jgi:hypothetical protein
MTRNTILTVPTFKTSAAVEISTRRKVCSAAAASSPAEQPFPIGVAAAEDYCPVLITKGLLLLIVAEPGESPAVQEQLGLEQDLRLPAAKLAYRQGLLRTVHPTTSFKDLRT